MIFNVRDLHSTRLSICEFSWKSPQGRPCFSYGASWNYIYWSTVKRYAVEEVKKVLGSMYTTPPFFTPVFTFFSRPPTSLHHSLICAHFQCNALWLAPFYRGNAIFLMWTQQGVGVPRHVTSVHYVVRTCVFMCHFQVMFITSVLSEDGRWLWSPVIHISHPVHCRGTR